jgi:hypothetical protein
MTTAETLHHRSGHNDDQKAVSKSEDQFLVKYEGNDYEISSFLDSHPAGRNILLPFRNRDLTNKFNEIGHSAEARKILLKHKIHKTDEDLALLATESSTNKEKVYKKVDAQFVFRKLFTPEDKYLVHKFFGFCSLLSFLYRYVYVLPTTGNLGMDGSALDIVTLVIHFFLTFSSLIFHVIEHRIPSRPLIIYEEYRLHAIIFTTRGILVSLLGFYCQEMEVIQRRWLLAMVILLSHLVVDYITSVHGMKGVTAVRNDGVLTFQYIGLFYSYYQIAALGSFVTWNDRLGDLGFNTLIAIQSSAFLMTLKRKSLIRWYSHAFWYSLCLALSYYVMWSINGSLFFLYPAILFFFRVKFGLSKYLLWPLYVIILYYFNLTA